MSDLPRQASSPNRGAAPQAGVVNGVSTLVRELHPGRHPNRRQRSPLKAAVAATLTHGELRSRARKLARILIGRDFAPGERVDVMLPTCIEFFVPFLAIPYTGAVPVPIDPPMRMSPLEENLRWKAGILRNVGARVRIVPADGRRLVDLMRLQVDSMKVVTSVAELEAGSAKLALAPIANAGSVALIQYASGSTGDPKRVMLSPANLLANIRANGMAMEAGSVDVFVSWLPLYRDMGLIDAWLGCLHFGAPLYVMSPLTFLVRPQRLWAMHRRRPGGPRTANPRSTTSPPAGHPAPPSGRCRLSHPAAANHGECHDREYRRGRLVRKSGSRRCGAGRRQECFAR